MSGLVGLKFELKQKIGSGSFGEIYLGVDIETNEKVAVKLEKKDAEYPQLAAEFNVYKHMKVNQRGVPKVYWFGDFDNGRVRYNALVMELLGPSLETLYSMCGRKFSLKTVTMLAIELLRRIEFQHSESYLHRDIKPDNFLMGLRQNSHMVYMIDLGLSKRFEDDNKRHVAYRENRKLIGTPRYTSINTHLGVEQTRRDDLESIAYMLFYFLKGKLPWQGLRAKTKDDKYQKILNKKMATKVEDLARGHPEEFGKLLKYAKELKFEQKPDYKMLRRWFYDLFRRSKWVDDCVFDWMKMSNWNTEVRRFEYSWISTTRVPKQAAFNQQALKLKEVKRENNSLKQEISRLKKIITAKDCLLSANAAEKVRFENQVRDLIRENVKLKIKAERQKKQVEKALQKSAEQLALEVVAMKKEKDDTGKKAELVKTELRRSKRDSSTGQTRVKRESPDTDGPSKVKREGPITDRNESTPTTVVTRSGRRVRRKVQLSNGKVIGRIEDEGESTEDA